MSLSPHSRSRPSRSCSKESSLIFFLIPTFRPTSEIAELAPAELPLLPPLPSMSSRQMRGASPRCSPAPSAATAAPGTARRSDTASWSRRTRPGRGHRRRRCRGRVALPVLRVEVGLHAGQRSNMFAASSCFSILTPEVLERIRPFADLLQRLVQASVAQHVQASKPRRCARHGDCCRARCRRL